jgi:response regulator RpfG family c-di-GMP phosphodiesterase
MAIPDSILLKPGKLTADEFDTMRQHTIIGAAILGNMYGMVWIWPKLLPSVTMNIGMD